MLYLADPGSSLAPYAPGNCPSSRNPRTAATHARRRPRGPEVHRSTAAPFPIYKVQAHFIAGGLKIVYDLALYRSFNKNKPPEEHKAA